MTVVNFCKVPRDMPEAYAATVCFTCEGEYSESIWTVSVRG
jgi:hypothetical protein